MAQQRMMRLFAKWHIWLGWLVGVPVLMWTVTGLIMVIKPIEEVRGTDLRLSGWEQPLPADTVISVALPADGEAPVRSVSTQLERGQVVTRITYMDGTSERIGEDGLTMDPLTEAEARAMVAEQIEGGDQVTSTTRFAADEVPLDFRRPLDVWRVTLADDTYVYVGAETARIEAVRTQWWRVFDFAWGLHIMDLETREDTSHPILILFAILSIIGAILGCVLMFRRRKARVKVPA